MTLHIYSRESRHNTDVLMSTGQQFRLAGRNLLHNAWEERGRPLRKGWRVSADDLIKLQSASRESYETRRLIIDYHPSSKKRIPLVELLEVFLFSWTEHGSDVVTWTPIMLRLRDVVDEWTVAPMTADERATRKAHLEVRQYGSESVEFLYLQGDAGGWNWGRNGSLNGAFLHDSARDYFRRFF